MSNYYMRTAALALAACLASYGSTIVTTPAGLAPGTEYQLAFVTYDGFLGNSPTIATYNADVTAEAALDAQLLAFDTTNGVTWTVVATTPDADASVNAPSSGLVYTLDGTEIASAANALYSGSILAPLDINQFGNTEAGAVLWTGSNSDGTNNNPFYELGGTFPIEGYTSATNGAWLDDTAGIFGDNSLTLYALSSVITVPSPSAVPEPGTVAIIPAAFALLFGAFRMRRSRAVPSGA
jgi:hypothetical protein